MSGQAKSRRLTLTLDATLPFEALIQERLETLPKARRQDWLRTLLVEGFKRESRQLKKLERKFAQPLRSVPADLRKSPVNGIRMPKAIGPQEATADPAIRSASRAQTSVSWAALRRVIGAEAPTCANGDRLI